MRSFAQAVLIPGVLAMAVAAAPAFAQRGGFGGSHSGGGHVSGGTSFGPTSRWSAPAAHGTMPLGGGRNFPIRTYGPPPLGLRPPAAGFTGIDPGALRSYGRGSRRRAPGYLFAPYYYPFVGYTDSSYDQFPSYDAAQDPNVQATLMHENMLGQQIKDLSAQIAELKQEQEAARPQPPDIAGAEEAPQPEGPPIHLVLRSGQQLQIRDYAVMNGTFWDFTSQPARRIPLSNIDIPASQKATADSGGEFPQLNGK